jgi:tetratricopeptide (TPR) repeat protein
LWPAAGAEDTDMLTRHDLKPNVLARLSGFTLPLTKRLLTCVLGVLLSAVCGGAVCGSAAPREQGAEHTDRALADKTFQEALALVEKEDWAGAVEKFKEARELYLRLTDARGEAKTERNVGWTYFLADAKNKDLALKHLNRSLDLCRSLADREGQGMALVYVGIVHNKTGDTKGALKPFEAFLPLLPQSWLRQHGGLVLNMMGDGYYDAGERQKAITTYKLALRFWQAHEDAGQVVATAEILGTIYLMEGDRDNALEYLKLARQSWHDLKNVQREAATIQSLAMLTRDAGDYAGAAFYYDLALSMYQEAKLRPQEAEAPHRMMRPMGKHR